MNLHTIGIIGSGQMGKGIATLFSQKGFKVFLYSRSSEKSQRTKEYITNFMSKGVDKEKWSHMQAESFLENICFTDDLNSLSCCDLIIEAISECMESKKAIFKQISKICKRECIISSNTSSLSITELATNVSSPERFIGFHFINPVHAMKMVEVISGLQTSQEVKRIINDLSIQLNKQVIYSDDTPGFTLNRILIPMINEAIYALSEGVSSAEQIDHALKLGANHPMGPLQLADFIGLDTCLAIMECIYDGLGDTKYRPCHLLKKYVKAGWLGRKTSRGFYQY